MLIPYWTGLSFLSGSLRTACRHLVHSRIQASLAPRLCRWSRSLVGLTPECRKHVTGRPVSFVCRVHVCLSKPNLPYRVVVPYSIYIRRQTDTQRQRDTYTERDTQRQREIHRDRERETERGRERETDRQTDRQKVRQAGRQTDWQRVSARIDNSVWEIE